MSTQQPSSSSSSSSSSASASAGGGGGAKKASPVTLDAATTTAPPRIPHSRSQALATHGRLLYRASMDEEGLNLPIVLTKEGFMADTRINNVMPRKDDEKAKHAWSIPPVETFQVCVSKVLWILADVVSRLLLFFGCGYISPCGLTDNHVDFVDDFVPA